MAKKEILPVQTQAPGGTATPAPPIVRPSASRASIPPVHSAIQRRHGRPQGKVSVLWVNGYKDRTSVFEVKKPAGQRASQGCRQAEKGSGEPNKNKIGKLTMAQCKELARKNQGPQSFDLDAAAKCSPHRDVRGNYREVKNIKARPQPTTVGALSGALLRRERFRMPTNTAVIIRSKRYKGRRQEASRKACTHRRGDRHRSESFKATKSTRASS